ncbi:MAG: GAF domain-containing protein [Dehalococcoidia bacterium]|nr:GAF domain-containing protein [Dehalococcoidia bacterium]
MLEVDKMDKQSRALIESRRISAIEKISEILVNERQKETSAQFILEYLIGALEVADAGIIWSYVPSTKSLVPEVASGIDLSTLKQVGLNTGQDMIGRVFQSGKSEYYPRSKARSANEDYAKKVSGVKIPGLDSTASVACIPLNSETAKYGVLTFLNSRRGAVFTHDDILFFQTIAYLLTLAMKMTALGKTLKQMEVIGTDEQYRAGLISTLAHEMRTPLTSIKGYATALLMKEAAFNSEKQREFLKIIDRECDILEDLIIDHLESSIIDAGMMKIDLQPVRLPRLAAKAANDVGRRFPQHSLLLDFAGDFPLIDADPDRILQVFRQLLDNAAKYSPEGGLIVLQGTIAEDKAIISVSDEGVGIAPEDLNHLFDRFFRAKSNSGAQIIGTGLGLPISRAIVEAHGGRIWAESQLGQGSKFCFSLPLKGPSRELVDE